MSRKSSFVAALALCLMTSNIVFGQAAEGVDPFGSDTPNSAPGQAKEKPRPGGGGLGGLRGPAARDAAEQRAPAAGELGQPNEDPAVGIAKSLKQPVDLEFADTPLA